MKKNWTETLCNEEIRRCGVVDIAEEDEVTLRWRGEEKKKT
jgi:hypothetical protein